MFQQNMLCFIAVPLLQGRKQQILVVVHSVDMCCDNWITDQDICTVFRQLSYWKCLIVLFSVTQLCVYSDQTTSRQQPLNYMNTCNSIIFFIMKNPISDISRNMIRAGTATNFFEISSFHMANVYKARLIWFWASQGTDTLKGVFPLYCGSMALRLIWHM